MAKAEKNGHASISEQWSVVAPGHSFGATDGYEKDNVQIWALTGRQAAALKRLTCSLRVDNARCSRRDAPTPDGMVVAREADAVRWLLDLLADHYESAKAV